MKETDKKSRRANGEGSISQRKDGIRVYQISVCGKTKTFTGKTRAAVVKKKKAYDLEQQQRLSLCSQMASFNVERIDEKLSLTQYVHDWIVLYKKLSNTKETTYSSYYTIWQRNI